MADEIIESVVGTDGGIVTGMDDGAALQANMTGDFFDEGAGAYIDEGGAELQNANGQPIRTKEELAAYKASANAPKGNTIPFPTQNAKPGATVKAPTAATPQRFDSMFKKDSGLDYDGMNKFGDKFSSVSWKSQLPTAKAAEPVHPAQPTSANPREAIRQELSEYKGILDNSLLSPIRKIYEKRVAAYNANGQQMPPDEFAAFQEQYVELESEVSTLVDRKNDELNDRLVKETESKFTNAEQEKKAIETYVSIANEYFPDTPADKRRDVLDSFIFGYNDGKTFVRGYGADTFELLFDNAMDAAGKTFKTTEEYNKAQTEWWTKFALDPNKLRYLAKVAYSEYERVNKPKIRDAWRSTWDKEHETRNKFKSKSAGSPIGGSIGVSEAQGAELEAYFAAPKANM